MPRVMHLRRTVKSSGSYFSLESVCEILDLSPRTLRLYERRGLIRAERVEETEGQPRALFTPDEVRRIQRIRLLTKEMGVNLAGVEIILRLLDQLERS